MKNILLNFYKKNRKILKIIQVNIVLLFITVFLMYYFIVNNTLVVVEFLETSTLTKSIVPFSILSLMAIVLFFLLVVLVTFIIIKALLPKDLSSLIMKDEASFLLSLPSRVKKEVLKNGK